MKIIPTARRHSAISSLAGLFPPAMSRNAVERPDDASFWHDTQDIWCDWDQKWRRTKSAISNVVDGFSQYLCFSPTPDSVQIQKEIDDATAKIGGPRKVLRAMWLSTFPPSPTACPKRVSMHRLGKHEDISFAEILLPYLSNVLWRYYGEWSLFTLKEEERRILRIMRSCCEFGSAPCERKCMELGQTEYSNSLRKLSQILASHAASAWSAYRSKNAANMGFLTDGFPLRSHAFSAAGNAIVPQIAAEVMKAWLEEFPI